MDLFWRAVLHQRNSFRRIKFDTLHSPNLIARTFSQDVRRQLEDGSVGVLLTKQHRT